MATLADNLSLLVQFARDVAAIDGGTLTSVQMGEMADGSGRSLAIVNVIDGDLEFQYRVTSPSPEGAPQWAWQYTAWLVEVNAGESWIELEVFDRGLHRDRPERAT